MHLLNQSIPYHRPDERICGRATSNSFQPRNEYLQRHGENYEGTFAATNNYNHWQYVPETSARYSMNPSMFGLREGPTRDRKLYLEKIK